MQGSEVRQFASGRTTHLAQSLAQRDIQGPWEIDCKSPTPQCIFSGHSYKTVIVQGKMLLQSRVSQPWGRHGGARQALTSLVHPLTLASPGLPRPRKCTAPGWPPHVVSMQMGALLYQIHPSCTHTDTTTRGPCASTPFQLTRHGPLYSQPEVTRPCPPCVCFQMPSSQKAGRILARARGSCSAWPGPL